MIKTGVLPLGVGEKNDGNYVDSAECLLIMQYKRNPIAKLNGKRGVIFSPLFFKYNYNQ